MKMYKFKLRKSDEYEYEMSIMSSDEILASTKDPMVLTSEPFEAHVEVIGASNRGNQVNVLVKGHSNVSQFLTCMTANEFLNMAMSDGFAKGSYVGMIQLYRQGKYVFIKSVEYDGL